MSSGSKDFYQVLGVGEKAEPEEIRKAYRRLAKKYHPDANPGDAGAEARFKEVAEAHAVLSDAEKRSQYDQIRTRGAFGFGGGRDPRAGGAGFPSGGEAFSFEDLGGLGDLFNGIFDRGRKGGGRRGGPQRGQDLEVSAEISFETAVQGGSIQVQIPVEEACKPCGGSGAAPGSALRSCGECAGTGSISFGQGGFAVKRPCPACLGRGRVPEIACSTCSGSGRSREVRKLQVTVPPGVDTGSRLRLSGQGAGGPPGGASGDLLLVFRVREHRFFRREGTDIHVTVPINLAQATLGSKVKVRTVGGKHVVLKIPPGTQSGTRFRISGQGVPRGERVGDQIVEVRVDLPETLGPEGEEAMKRLAGLLGLRY